MINHSFIKRAILEVAFFLLLLTGCKDPVLKPSVVVVRAPEHISPVSGKWVRPVIYDNQMDFNLLPARDKKKKFIDMLLPCVLLVKHNLAVERSRVGNIILMHEKGEVVSSDDSLFLVSQMERYRAHDYKNLFNRMATHPTSITLAQAAIESGWGTSRFFKEANNTFGIWSYNANEDRIEASASRGGAPVYLRTYPNLTGSVRDYFFTLGRVKAYKDYRKQRLSLRDPYQLTHYLKNYSELRSIYVSRLNMMIRENNLTQYDSLKLDPAYYYPHEKITL